MNNFTRAQSQPLPDFKLTELFEQARIAQAQGTPQKLAPGQHTNRDFFVADILEWALKDDRASMEHPFFSLSKKPDHKARHYDHNGNSITITPSFKGLATIWDKDILIFAVSQLVAAMNQGRPVTRKVRLKAYDLYELARKHCGRQSTWSVALKDSGSWTIGKLSKRPRRVG